MSLSSVYFNNSSLPTTNNAQYMYNPTTSSQLNLSGDFTIEFWMKANTQNGKYPLIMAVNSSWGSGSGIDICVSHSINPGKFTIVTDLYGSYSSNTNVCDGVWHNIAIVRQSNMLSVYIDGTLSGSPKLFSNTWSFSKFSIGTNPSDRNVEISYTGYFSNLRIVDYCLYTSNYTVSNTLYGNIPGTLLLMTINSLNPLLDQSNYNVAISLSNSNPIITSGVVPPLQSVIITNVICFNRGSKILTDQGYILVDELKTGDLVKTIHHGFVPIEKIENKPFVNCPIDERVKDQLYICKTDKYPELMEDLILTGCHSILVKDFATEEQKEATIRINGDTYITDNHYRLPVCVDDRASIYQESGEYTIYHFALQHDNCFMNYGIYANGLLVETTSLHNLCAFFGN